MAQGYIKVITTGHASVDVFFNKWCETVANSYELYKADGKIDVFLWFEKIDEYQMLSIKDIVTLLSQKKDVLIMFVNSLGNTITCSFTLMDNYIFIENYGIDQLLADTEVQELKQFAKKRFEEFYSDDKAVGFYLIPKAIVRIIFTSKEFNLQGDILFFQTTS